MSKRNILSRIVVHHKDHNHSNDHPDNRIKMELSDHSYYHMIHRTHVYTVKQHLLKLGIIIDDTSR
jgi:hypothetical protein